MALLFRELPDTHGEVKRLSEVFETIFLFEMVFVDHLPAIIDVAQEPLELGAFDRQHTAPARHALFRSQVIHRLSPDRF
jgi:hypothetical protein